MSWAVAAPVLVGWYMMARVLDLDTELVEAVRDWWCRLAFTGRHSVRGQRRQRRAAWRAERVREAGVRDALDRVWVGAIGAWAERARGDGLHRSQVAVR